MVGRFRGDSSKRSRYRRYLSSAGKTKAAIIVGTTTTTQVSQSGADSSFVFGVFRFDGWRRFRRRRHLELDPRHTPTPRW